MTESEELFEQLCESHGIVFRRIPEGDVRTPDYELTLTCGPVLVEVKQLELNSDDERVAKELRTAGRSFHWVDAGRSRLAIRKALKQLHLAKGKFPTIVVLYDTMGMRKYLDAYSVAHVLYGPEQSHILVPEYPQAEMIFTGISRGGDGLATPTDNTTLSAVGILEGPAHGLSPNLRIFHNRHALVRLPVSALADFRFRQFEFASPAPDAAPTWIECASNRQ